MTLTCTPNLDAHRAKLRASFLDWLIEMEPTDVFDLGAGNGALVAALGERGVRAAGLEASPERVAEARALDRPVDRGSAERTGRADGSAGWATVRHVLHHVQSPELVLKEALRIAREGVLIAEPISLTALPMHAANLRLENALRALDRARGMFHAADLSPERIAALLPADALVEVRIVAPMTRLPRAEVEYLVERSCGGLPVDAEGQESLAAALADADAGRLAPSGTAMIAARLGGR